VGEKEEVRLCGLAGAKEQKLRLSRTGEKGEKGRGRRDGRGDEAQTHCKEEGRDSN
jgi:hypothetical protein